MYIQMIEHKSDGDGGCSTSFLWFYKDILYIFLLFGWIESQSAQQESDSRPGLFCNLFFLAWMPNPFSKHNSMNGRSEPVPLLYPVFYVYSYYLKIKKELSQTKTLSILISSLQINFYNPYFCCFTYPIWQSCWIQNDKYPVRETQSLAK